MFRSLHLTPTLFFLALLPAGLVLMGAAGPPVGITEPPVGMTEPPIGVAEPPITAGELEMFETLQNKIIEIAERIQPSVVHVEAIVKEHIQKAKVAGSGIIADEEGHILTNHHIIDEATKITVTVPGIVKKFPAELVGTDPQTDVAVLKIKPDSPLHVAEFGDSSKIRVGEWVIAVGNPYGLDGTVSFGIISAKGRNLDRIDDILNEFIQTDAMIDRGSSGGPLVNLHGEIIGINSRGQGRGIGFTIPITTALDVKQKLIEAGKVKRGYLGITIQPLSRDLAEHFEFPLETGVIVNYVRENTPAEKAGLQIGDIIVSFGDENIEAEEERDLNKFQRVIAYTEADSVRPIGILRDGQRITLTVEVGNQPKVKPDEEETDYGFHVKEITEGLFYEQRLDHKEGVLVSFVEKGSPASEADLFPGDVIKKIGEEEIGDIEDFREVMKGAGGRKKILVIALRGKDQLFLLIKPEKEEEEERETTEASAEAAPPPEEAPSPDSPPAEQKPEPQPSEKNPAVDTLINP